MSKKRCVSVVAATTTTATHKGRHAAPIAGVAATAMSDDSSIHSKIQDEVRQKMEQRVKLGTPWPELPPTTNAEAVVPTGVRKVVRRSGTITYIVRIRCQNKRHYIGSWPCAALAAQAYLYATAFVPEQAARNEVAEKKKKEIAARKVERKRRKKEKIEIEKVERKKRKKEGRKKKW